MRKTFVKSVLWLSVMAMSQVSIAGWDEGSAAFDRKDYATALKEFTVLAEQGDALAAFYVATLFNQQGLYKLDPVEATKWYKMAAERGHPASARIMGYRYLNALGGVSKDEAQAVRWFKRAADLGDTQAQTSFNLGVMYHLGQGVDKDTNEAEKWFLKAQTMGHPNATEALKGLKK
jgi:uncharacterized protein